jgi:flagellar protein FliL
MAIEEVEKQEEKEEEKPKDKKFPIKKVIIIASIAILGLVLAFGGFFVYKSMTSGEAKEATSTKTENKKEGEPGSQVKETVVSALDTFYANLADKGEIRYLKITISLELDSSSTEELIKKNLARIRDDILMLLNSKTIDEVTPTKGKMLLKNQIKNRVNLILKPNGMINNVYFTEFIIQ